MKLTTIWTIPAMTLPERLRRTGEAATRWVAHRLPARLRYWVVINAGARHIGGSEEVSAVPLLTVVRRMSGGAADA